MTSHHGATATDKHTTGVRDEMYDVVSVLYHALQGGETCIQYLQDAQEAGDQQLMQFFHEVQESHRHLATRAKEVLVQCLDHGNSHESHHDMGTGTQALGMTGSQTPTHSSQGAMGSRGQGREERQGHDREHQEHRR